MPDDSGLRPCRPTPARARARRARCGTGVNNIVHSSGVRSNRIVNRVPTPPGDTYGPYFALISLWVMNTTTLTRRPPTVRPHYASHAGPLVTNLRPPAPPPICAHLRRRPSPRVAAPCLPAQPSDAHAPSLRRCVVHVLPVASACGLACLRGGARGACGSWVAARVVASACAPEGARLHAAVLVCYACVAVR